jgi:hypothetical protein
VISCFASLFSPESNADTNKKFSLLAHTVNRHIRKSPNKGRSLKYNEQKPTRLGFYPFGVISTSKMNM